MEYIAKVIAYEALYQRYRNMWEQPLSDGLATRSEFICFGMAHSYLESYARCEGLL